MIILDLESFFDTKAKYDFGSMSMTEYCYDRRARCHCMAWTDTVTGEVGCEWELSNIKYLLTKWGEQNETMAAYNAAFDFQFIIANNLGPLVPKKLFCLQLMALHILGINKIHRIGLETVASLLNKHVQKHKGEGSTESFDGLRTIPKTMRPSVEKYAIDDVLSAAEVFEHLAQENKIKNQQLWSINWSLRQFLFPKLALDKSELKSLINQEKTEREQMLSRIGVEDGAVFRSVASWAQLLREHGEELPTKKNPKGEDILQGAKTDPFVMQNKDRQDIIGDIVRARLLFSSNQVRTRAESYLKIAELDVGWPMHVWPSGAHTHRPVGRDGGGGNPLNLDKNKLEKKYGIRNAVIPADDNQVLVIFDYTGIELRVARWLCQDDTSIEAILNGQDLYKVFASKAYKVDYDDVTADQRFIGKQAELSCQYGLGAAKFRDRLKQEGVGYTEAEAREQINNFRYVVHPQVRSAWVLLDKLLASYRKSTGKHILDNLNMPEHEWHPATGITWPSGRLLSYYGREQQQGKYGVETIYHPRSPWGDKSGPVNIWGGTLLENICQSITNEIVDSRKRVIESELGVDVAFEVYDEMIVPVDIDKVQEMCTKITEIATRPISWWPDGPPLDIDMQVVTRYGDVVK